MTLSEIPTNAFESNKYHSLNTCQNWNLWMDIPNLHMTSSLCVESLDLFRRTLVSLGALE